MQAMTTALLVIDVQQGNTAEAYDRAGVIGRIRGLIDRARADDVPVIWVQHEAGPFVPGSEPWQIVEEVRPGEGDPVVAKTYLDSFAETDLRARLDALGVTRLVLCGAATDACVRSTAARSQVEGYDTVLVADGHTTDEGPWPLPLPDGSTVPVGAKEMIAFTNFFVADTDYPGITTEVVPAEEVTW